MANQRLLLEIDGSPAYQFVLAIAAAASGGGDPELPAALRDQARRFSGGCDMVWAHVLTIAYDLPPPRDADSLIAEVHRLHPRELRLRLLGYYVRYFRRATPPELIARACAGDRVAMTAFAETSYPDDPQWQAALAALLPLSGQQTKRELLEILRDWLPFFARVHDPRPVAAEVASKRAQARTLPPERMVAAVMGGWEYVPEPGVNAVLVIPSSAAWPAAHVFDHHSTKIVCYPFQPAMVGDPTTPPAELVATGQAIADQRRLRVLRALAVEELGAQELASRLALGLTTLLHHLNLLRDAGLVEASGTRRKRYRLHPTALRRLQERLEAYVYS